MSSSLASQLQQLREDGAGSKRRVVSLLYDSRDAVRLDDAMVYNMACNGLLELQKQDGRFDEFYDQDENHDPHSSATHSSHDQLLFTRQRVHFHRATLTKEQDQALTQSINKLLDALSGYFLLNASHKVLEFLVRRYEIHRYHVDHVMAMMLCYHESEMFGKMMKLLHIHATKWEFLLLAKQNATPVTREVLVTRALDDVSLLDFLFETCKRLASQNPRVVSLYTLVVLQLLDRMNKLDETQLRWLVPQLLAALKRKDLPEFQSSAYMIVSKLCSKAVLAPKVVETMALYLTKYCCEPNQTNAVLSVVFMAQSQPEFEIQHKLAKYLLRVASLPDCLAEICVHYDASKFLRALLRFLVTHLKDQTLELLTSLIDAVPIELYVEEMVMELLDQAQRHDFDVAKHAQVESICALLQAFSYQYLAQVEKAIHHMLQRDMPRPQQAQLHAFLTKTFAKVTDSAHFLPFAGDKTTSLLLALDHPTEETRYQALVTLDKKLEEQAHEEHTSDDSDASTTSKTLLLTNGDVALRRLTDDSAKIVSFVVSSRVGDFALANCPTEDCFKAITQAIQRWSGTGGSMALLEQLATFLVEKFLLQNEDLTTKSRNHFNEEILRVLLGLVPLQKKHKPKDLKLSMATCVALMKRLDHVLCSAAGGLAKVHDLASLVQQFGRVLSQNASELLSFVLSWQHNSEEAIGPLDLFMVRVLFDAWRQSTSRADSNEFVRQVCTQLKRLFMLVCRHDEKSVVLELGDMIVQLCRALIDTNQVACDELVATLLSSGSHNFTLVQSNCMLKLFEDDMAPHLVPTMKRLVFNSSDRVRLLAKCRSLQLLHALCTAFAQQKDQSKTARETMWRNLDQMVPCMLFALSHAHRSIRETAMTCLECVVQVCSKSESQALWSTLHDGLDALLQCRKDVLLDANAVRTLFGNMEAENAAFFTLVWNMVAGEEPKCLGQVLQLFEQVRTPQLWSETTGLFNQTLATVTTTASEPNSKAQWTVLSTLMHHYMDLKTLCSSQATPSKSNKTNPGMTVWKPLVDAILSVLDCQGPLAALEKLHLVVIKNLSPELYNALNHETRQALVSQLVKLLVKSNEAAVSAIVKCFCRLPLDVAVLVQLVDENQHTGVHEITCVLEIVAVKVKAESLTGNVFVLFEKLAAVLDQLTGEQTTSDYLYQILFSCLRRVCECATQQGVTVPAIKMPSTRNGTNKPTTKTGGAGALLTLSAASPEVIVKNLLTCLARTTSLQTRNEALLLISCVVALFPQHVQESIASVLEFVAQQTIGQQDEYSFYVLKQIIASIVPQLMKPSERTKSSATGTSGLSMQQFLEIFVHAFDRIPSHRQFPLFQVLVQEISSSEALPLIVSMLLNQVSSTELQDVEEKRVTRVAFCHQLCHGTSGVQQIACLNVLLRFAKEMFPRVTAKSSDEDMDDVSDDEGEDDERQHFMLADNVPVSKACTLNLLLIEFIPAHLQSKELHYQLLKEEEEAMRPEEDGDDQETYLESQLQPKYLRMIESVLFYFQRVSLQTAAHADATATTFWHQVTRHTMEILENVQQLLSIPSFVALISELLHHDNQHIRHKALQLLNDKLSAQASRLRHEEKCLLLEMLDEIQSLLNESEETKHNKQIALLSINILVHHFTQDHVQRNAPNEQIMQTLRTKLETLVPSILAFVGTDDLAIDKTSSDELHMMASAFMCLASICEAISTRMVRFLPKFVPNLLDALEFAVADSKKITDLSVLQCLLNALDVFTTRIPKFLTKDLERLLSLLLSNQLLNVAGDSNLVLTLDGCLMNLCHGMDRRLLFPTIFGLFDTMVAPTKRTAVTTIASVPSLRKFLFVVSTVVASLESVELRSCLGLFARFFLKTMDYRRLCGTTKLFDEELEDEMLDIFAEFILKLNEKQWKPLFMKLCEWSQVSMPTPVMRVARRTSFFKFVVVLSDRLKSILVPYYAHLINLLSDSLKESCKLLESTNSCGHGGASDDEKTDEEDEDEFFLGDHHNNKESELDDDERDLPSLKKQKLANGQSSAAAHKSSSKTPKVPPSLVTREDGFLLLRTAVRALNGCFVHDQDGFMDKDQFEVVMTPLVDTLDILPLAHHADEAKEFQSFVFEGVAGCVANLAWAAKSDLLWKPLHYAVLTKARDTNALVRLGSLYAIEKCYQVVGDEFLAMLPESIPFLAELMEDTNAQVESKCHQVIKQIEEMSGESLDQYLTS